MLTAKQLFFQHIAQTSHEPMALEIEKAQGIWMYDKDGKKYLDLISGIAVSNVGHRHPKVISAIKNQMDKYLHLMVYGEYIQHPQVQLAKKLVDILPSELDNVYFVNSGSEANEGALKLAKRFTNRHKIMTFKNTYHGSTHGALSVMGNEEFKNSFRPLVPGVEIINYNQKSDLEQINEDFAAVIVEGIQGEGGYNVPEKSFIQALRKRCDETKTLLIFDEVQTGIGRTGKWFSFMHFDVVPDIFTIAKGFGGGLPLGAFIASEKIMHVYKENPVLGHITTFGGNPVCCASALAVLEIIEEENLMLSIPEKEKMFRELLVYPQIKNITGKGLMLALEFETPEINFKVIENCKNLGLITDWFLFKDNALRISPPLIISEPEIKLACEIILKAISKLN